MFRCPSFSSETSRNIWCKNFLQEYSRCKESYMHLICGTDQTYQSEAATLSEDEMSWCTSSPRLRGSEWSCQQVKYTEIDNAPGVDLRKQRNSKPRTFKLPAQNCKWPRTRTSCPTEGCTQIYVRNCAYIYIYIHIIILYNLYNKIL